MIKRLIDFYWRSSGNAESCMRDIWRGITTVYHGNLERALLSGDEQKTQNALDNFGANGGFQGIETLEPFLLFDEHPEYEKFREAGIDMSLPDFCGFKCAGGVPTHFPLYCDIALLIKSDTGNKIPSRVLEIGPGIGFLGVILLRLGARRYTVIDLPSGCVFVAHFLSRCFGSDKIWLYGEERDASKPIHIYPCTNYAGVTEDRYDVICNVNSFPEIPHEEQRKYVALIADLLAPDGFFLSVNHESEYLGQRGVTAAMGEQNRLFCASKVPSEVFHAPKQPDSGYFEEVYLPVSRKPK